VGSSGVAVPPADGGIQTGRCPETDEASSGGPAARAPRVGGTMGEELFRKAALDKLASPERLDVTMAVTSPRGWIALWTIGGVLLCVIAWGIFGSIPTRVDGVGILLRGGSLREIKAEGAGTLVSLTIKVGDILQADQSVGEIDQQAAADQVNQLKVKHERAVQELETATLEDQATLAGYRADIARLLSETGRLEADLVQKRDLLAKGLITRQRVDQQEQQLLSLRAQETQLNATIRNVQQNTRARAAAAEQARLEYERASKTAASVTGLRSTGAGRVVELKKRVGDRVTEGEAVAVVEPPSAMLEPLVYVNAALGKKIRPGMEAQISPSSVKIEEYGFLRGTIKTVGDYPVTPQAVSSALANDAFARQLLGESAKIEVWAQLAVDTATPSGYGWSSSSGPPFKIDSGTPITVSVVVDRRAPISYIIPMIRGAVGAS
jgi:HlyD family secretion protein